MAGSQYILLTKGLRCARMPAMHHQYFYMNLPLTLSIVDLHNPPNLIRNLCHIRVFVAVMIM
eukprot:8203831-Karenia_brevis.AAC.1